MLEDIFVSSQQCKALFNLQDSLMCAHRDKPFFRSGQTCSLRRDINFLLDRTGRTSSPGEYSPFRAVAFATIHEPLGSLLWSCNLQFSLFQNFEKGALKYVLSKIGLGLHFANSNLRIVLILTFEEFTHMFRRRVLAMWFYAPVQAGLYGRVKPLSRPCP
jgi:hypothetical protein